MLLRYAHAARVLVLTTFMVGLAAVTFASPAQAATFGDTAGEDFDPAVGALVAQDVVVGCGEGEFCPRDAITRGQMASMLARALDLPDAEGTRFSDAAGSAHEGSINALADAGITQGCAEDRFCPNDQTTRAEMASLMTAAFDIPSSDQRHFDDIGGVHAPAIEDLATAGITSGCGTALTDFCPRDEILRWQTAVFVARAMNLEDRVELAPLDERRERQAEIDAEEQRRLEQQREAERQARAERQAAERDRMWERLAQCESGGNWSINTGNGYYGGLQFSRSSWQWVGGSGYPHNASRSEQIRRAEILLERQGWGAWPACSRKLGYR